MTRARAEASEAVLALRARRHRTLPGLALRSPAEARAWVREVDLATQTPDEFLPSLFAAVQGEPYRPEAGGFGRWPAHAWWWGGELPEDGDILALKIYRKKTVFVARPLWPAIARAFPAPPKGRRDSLEDAIVAHLAAEGPQPGDAVRRALGVDYKTFTRARNALEARGAIHTRERAGGSEEHGAPWVLVHPDHFWDGPTRRAAAKLSPVAARAALYVAALEAAVLAPRKKVEAWFPFGRADARAAIDLALADGRLVPAPLSRPPAAGRGPEAGRARADGITTPKVLAAAGVA